MPGFPTMPDDPDPDAGRRVFRQWLEELADRLTKAEGVPWSDAFDAVVDVADSSPDPTNEKVLLEATRRYLKVRDALDGPTPAQILIEVKEELE